MESMTDNEYESYMAFWRRSVKNGTLREDVDSDPNVANCDPMLWIDGDDDG